jgi:hypothetical protein
MMERTDDHVTLSGTLVAGHETLASPETGQVGARVRGLETFLLELGGAFTFVGRQRRLRVGDE